jgi:hypothetical protein
MRRHGQFESATQVLRHLSLPWSGNSCCQALPLPAQQKQARSSARHRECIRGIPQAASPRSDRNPDNWGERCPRHRSISSSLADSATTAANPEQTCLCYRAYFLFSSRLQDGPQTQQRLRPNAHASYSACPARGRARSNRARSRRSASCPHLRGRGCGNAGRTRRYSGHNVGVYAR